MKENTKALSHRNTFFMEAARFYRAYGLLISSEVSLSHFPEEISFLEPDVHIRCGEVFGPDYTPPSSIQIETSPGRLLLRGARSATILVAGGDSITIELLPNGNPETTRQILLGWALGGLFHQRTMLPLHASAVCRNDNCFVFCAPSGTGKSTLTAAFLNRGFLFLDDNIALVNFEEGAAFIVPGSPEIRLWKNAMPGLEFEYENKGHIRPDREKVSLIARQKFRSERARLKRIFALKRSNDASFSITNITGAAKFKILLENVFFIQIMGHYKSSFGLFKLVHELAMKVPVTEISFPSRTSPDQLRKSIEQVGLMR